MSKEKMQEAKRYIQAKDYARARAILKTVNHPTAREWEVKLDRIQPPTNDIQHQVGLNNKLIIGGAVSVIVIIVAIIVIFLMSQAGTTGEVVELTETTSNNDASESGDPPVAVGDERPENLPVEFPFPEGGFTPALGEHSFTVSNSGEIYVSVYSLLNADDLEAFYRAALPAAEYEFLDFSAGDNMILSFVGHGFMGNVRVTQDGENGETRLTIELEPTDATSIDELTNPTESSAINMSFDDPLEATQMFMNLVFSDDTESALSLICTEMRFEMDERMLQSFIPPIPLAELDPSPLVYTLMSQDSNSAEVEISGQITVTITANNNSTTADFGPLTFMLKNEDGWKICPL